MQRNLFSTSARIAFASDDAAASGNTNAPAAAIVAPIASAKPKPAKRAAKPAAAKPTPTAKAKPAKPATAKPADAARAKLTEADRIAARRFYDGASLAVHSSRPRKRADYAAVALVPVQIANSESVRDGSGLAVILGRADSAGNFDPCAGSGLDLGICSRLSSLGFIAYDAKRDTFSLTPSGLARAKAITNRAKRA